MLLLKATFSGDNNKGLCWICGSHANSREHIIKKSDLIRAYGRGPYKGENGLLHFRGGDLVNIVKGPNANCLKYDQSICHHCNTTFTQPFDKAYDLFVNWVMENENYVLKRRFINFTEVYGDNFEESQRNLFKYFAKSFGCRIASSGYPVPTDVRILMHLTYFRTNLSITFSVNEDTILLMPSSDKDGFIGKGDLNVIVNKYKPDQVKGYYWSEHVSWFTIFYWYKRWPDGNLGSPWIANSQHIYLGSYKPLPPEMREDIMAKQKHL